MLSLMQAIFGATNYLGNLSGSQGFNALGIVSKTGCSKSFDADSDGYMRAEGSFRCYRLLCN